MLNENIKLYQGDCLEVMDKLIAEGVKVDAIITDPPYGTTACKWDSVIDFDEMWERLKKLRNDNTPIVLFGSEPFSSALRMSNIKEYKYDWIWKKTKAQGFLNSKKMPLKDYENILTFYNKPPIYNPQGVVYGKFKTDRKAKQQHGIGVYGIEKEYGYSGISNFPKQIIEFSNPSGKGHLHPTQKPVDLLEYLIKTYTNEGDIILDFTMGSGSTGVACVNTNRKFIGIELDENYFKIASDRIHNK